MLRSWILVLLLMCVVSEVSEARGKNRGMRYQRNGYSTSYSRPQSSVVYSNGMTFNSGSRNVMNQYQPTRQVSYSPSGSTMIQGHSMQGNSMQGNSMQGNSMQGNSMQGNSMQGNSMHGNSMQAWAEEEARLMASRGTCGHVRGAPSGHFVGVGCGTTCMGSGRLVAEAHYQGKSVRVWQQ